MNHKINRLGFIIPGLLLSLFVAAMDQTIVSTSLGDIVSDLGNIDQYLWVTSSYLIMELAFMPVYGKLSDMYGRKLFFLIGLSLFLVGSIFCGLADSILELSIFRAIQGLGAGALMPVVYTIIYSIIPDHLRSKIGGLFGSAFGLASICGPLLGSFITEILGWRWIFYINLIPGFISLFLILFFYQERHKRVNQKIDWWGTLLLITSIGCGIFALEMGGKVYSWNSFVIISLSSTCIFLLCFFIYIQAKVSEPIFSFELFQKRLFAVSCVLAFLYGSIYIVVIVYIPMFVQGVLGKSASNSGFILAPLLLTSILTSMSGGFLVKKIGYRYTMIISAVLLTCGILLLTRMNIHTTQLQASFYMILVGMGIGHSFSVLTIGANQSATNKNRGSSNSTLSFLRALGMTLGITIYGIIQKNLFTNRISSLFPSSHLYSDPHSILTPETRGELPTPVLDKLTDSLSSSLTHMFLWLLFLS